jgi:uncharacterized protein
MPTAAEVHGDAGLPASALLAALRWLLLSPPLVAVPQGMTTQLASFDAAESAGIAQWLASLQADGQALQAWVHAHPEARIGRYAERLLEFYLLHACTYAPLHRLVASHVPLRSVANGLKVTQGELDFLLTNAYGQHLHWELAVKFFLCTATGDVATPADFIGPNGVETLAHKWHKLFARQLTHTPPAPWDAHAWQPQAFTRGWMFYRWGYKVPQCNALHPEHGKAWWVDWADMRALPDAGYVHLPRLHWMAPVSSVQQLGSKVVVLQRDAMAAYLRRLWQTSERHTDAQMVVLLNAGHTDNATAYEVQRFFIRPAKSMLT